MGDNQQDGINVGLLLSAEASSRRLETRDHPPSAALITGCQRRQGRRSIYLDRHGRSLTVSAVVSDRRMRL